MIKPVKKIIKNILGEIYYNTYRKNRNNIGNRILIYHAFGTILDHDTYGISIDPKVFECHLKYLKDNYKLNPILKKNFIDIKDNSISISIDDGYKDNLLAVEILEKYEIPYTIFVTTSFIGKENYLSVDDICNINDSELCTIGSHTVNHISLKHLRTSEVEYELGKSKDILEDILGEAVSSFSYPYGEYNKEVKRLSSLIYEIVCCSKLGLNTNNCSLKSLNRTEIIATDRVRDLKKKILGYYDFLNQFK